VRILLVEIAGGAIREQQQTQDHLQGHQAKCLARSGPAKSKELRSRRIAEATRQRNKEMTAAVMGKPAPCRRTAENNRVDVKFENRGSGFIASLYYLVRCGNRFVPMNVRLQAKNASDIMAQFCSPRRWNSPSEQKVTNQIVRRAPGSPWTMSDISSQFFASLPVKAGLQSALA